MAIRKSDSLLEVVQATSTNATQRIISNKKEPDVWGNVLLCDIDSKWRGSEGMGENQSVTVRMTIRAIWGSLAAKFSKLPDSHKVRAVPNPPHIPSVSRPFIDISHSDMRRWQLALACEDLAEVPRQLLMDRIRNLPRFEDHEQYIPLYVGFGVVSLIYGGLHCLAWNAPFASTQETILWRLSSVVIAASGLLVPALSSWRKYPAFRYMPQVEYIENKVDKLLLRLRVDIFGARMQKLLLWWLAERLDKKYQAMKARLDPPPAWRRALLLYAIIALRLPAYCAYVTLPVFRFLRHVISVLVMFLYVLLRLVFDIGTISFILLYFLSRGYLVVVSFINLAHLSESAYSLPSWSSYVPHIG